jgi:hypothetical protein
MVMNISDSGMVGVGRTPPKKSRSVHRDSGLSAERAPTSDHACAAVVSYDASA